jgi:hypothetical protein
MDVFQMSLDVGAASPFEHFEPFRGGYKLKRWLKTAPRCQLHPATKNQSLPIMDKTARVFPTTFGTIVLRAVTNFGVSFSHNGD